MSFPSADQLQKALSLDVFHYAKDNKKAAGRALGTLVEVITFYMLKSWHTGKHIAIERHLAEYSNADITHNVEYSLHPSAPVATLEFSAPKLPLTSRKIAKALADKGVLNKDNAWKSNQLLSSDRVLRNACTMRTTAIPSSWHHSPPWMTTWPLLR